MAIEEDRVIDFKDNWSKFSLRFPHNHKTLAKAGKFEYGDPFLQLDGESYDFDNTKKLRRGNKQ
jgi:hypothetical protein